VVLGTRSERLDATGMAGIDWNQLPRVQIDRRTPNGYSLDANRTELDSTGHDWTPSDTPDTTGQPKIVVNACRVCRGSCTSTPKIGRPIGPNRFTWPEHRRKSCGKSQKCWFTLAKNHGNRASFPRFGQNLGFFNEQNRAVFAPRDAWSVASSGARGRVAKCRDDDVRVASSG